MIERNDDFALVCDFNDMGWKESAIGIEGCEWQEDQLTFQIALPCSVKKKRAETEKSI